MKHTLESECSVPSLSLWSLSSSFAQKQTENINVKGNFLNPVLRESKLYVRLAVYCLAINSMTVYRFPEAVYNYGGSVILAYTIIMLLMIQPIVYSELLLGQLYLRNLPARSANCLFGKMATAIKVTSAVLVLIFLPNQSIFQNYGNIWLDFDATSSKLTWCSCDSVNPLPSRNQSYKMSGGDTRVSNESICIDHENLSDVNPIMELTFNISDTEYMETIGTPEVAPAFYLRDHVLNTIPSGLQQESSIQDTFNWKLILTGFGYAFVILCFTLENRLSPYFPKILLWVTILLPVTFLGFLFYQLNISGRVETMMQLISLDWRDFSRIQMWQEALGLAVVTTSLGLGLHSTVSSSTRISYRKYYSVSWMFMFFGITTALISTLVVFAEVEVLTIFIASTYTNDVVSKTPGIASALFASVFCHSDSSWLKSLYRVFWVTKTVAFCYVQILAAETISRTVSTNKISNSDRKTLRFCIKASIIIFTQVVMIVPYAFQGSGKLLQNTFLFDGLLPIMLLTLIKIGYLSVYKSVNIFEEDLYLTYRLKLSKLFAFQIKYCFTFILLLASTLLLLCRGGSWLLRTYQQSSRLSLCDWPILYGVTLNLIPIVVFVVILIWQICALNWKKRFDRSARLVRARKPQDPIHKWRQEIRGVAYSDSEINTRTATVNTSRLRNPSNFSTLGICYNSNNFDVEGNNGNLNNNTLSSRDLGVTTAPATPDRTVTAEAPNSKQEPLKIPLELELRRKLSRISSGKRTSTKRKSTRHRVVRQIRRRRQPLPLEWSPGGLGDFTLFNVHLNGKPPGPEPMLNRDNVLSTQARFILPSLTTPVAEADDSILDFELPPPPKFLLQEYRATLDEETPSTSASVQNQGISNNFVSQSTGGECQEILSVLEELDGALNEPQVEGSQLGRLGSPRPTFNFNFADLVTPRVANELNISFGSASSVSQEDLNTSFVSNEFHDGSSACHSFLFTNENQL